jgi:GNAT superfamily N-acetyltransferase
MAIRVRPILVDEFVNLVPALVALLIDTVHTGASLGFLPSVTLDEVRDYWTSICPELRDRKRVLVGAFDDGRIVGSGQLAFSSFPNARHRAELQKLFVGSTLRGQGVGRTLVSALHAAARERGRSLVLLNTRRGGPAERFYKELGYKEVGVVPGYYVGPTGERIDNIALYQELAP